jgi:peptide/nickel transport system substrate-binding protein
MCRAIIVAALAAGALVFGNGPAAASTLRWSNQADALSLDPHANNETMTLRFLGNVYDPLVTRDEQGQFVPALATEWNIVDPKRWRFKLRQGVHFEEGQLLTPEDVVFSIHRAGLPSSGITAQAAGIDHVEIVDPQTIDIVTRTPRPTLLAELSSIDIMSQPWCIEHGAQETANNNQGKVGYTTTHANGTGAYRITERAADSKTVFVRTPNWWGTYQGNVTEVVFTPIKNASTRIAALLSGKLDLIQPVPVQDIARLSESEGMKVLKSPEIRTIYIGLNNAPTLASGQKNPMHDQRVREAMYRAIDEGSIVRSIMRGFAVPTALFVPKGVNGYDAADDVRYPYDPAKAKALLAAAGYPNGFAINMECPNDRYVNDEAICTAAVSMLARVGITVTLRAQTKAVYMQTIMNNPVDSYLQGWSPNSWDAYEAFFYNLATRFDANPPVPLGEGQGLFNIGRYSNPALDALLLKISQTLDTTERQKLMSEVNRIYVRDIPSIPLHQQDIIWGADKAVTASPTRDDSVTFRWISVAE